MVCKNCGNEMREDAKFCPHCGAVNAPGAQLQNVSGTQSPTWEKPEGGKKKTGLIIGSVVAAVAAVALIAAAVSGMFSSSKKQVEKAVGRSIAAYTQAWKNTGLPDLTPLTLERSVSQRFSLQLTGLNTAITGYDLSSLAGLGLRMNSGVSGKERKLDIKLAAFWDEEDIISLYMAAQDDELYFASPELTGGTFYGVNTETLGKDLTAMGAEGAENISFNIFDLVDVAASSVEKQQEAKQAFRQANQELADVAAVKKAGTKTLDINGTEQKTMAYRVTIPQQAMENYVDALAAVMDSVDYMEIYEEMFRAAGMPEDEIEDFLSGLDPYGDMAEDLKDVLDELGDVELELCLYGGYVAAVRWEDDINGHEVEALLTLGGGEEYVDDLGLEVEADGMKMTVESSGSHSGKGGIFTDTTTIRSGTVRIKSELRYEPKGKSNNLEWEIGVPNSVVFAMEGNLTTTKDSVHLKMEDIAVKVLGMELVNLTMDYYTGPWDGQSVDVGTPTLITGLNEAGLLELGNQLQTNGQNWLLQAQQLFIQRIPSDVLRALLS